MAHRITDSALLITQCLLAYLEAFSFLVPLFHRLSGCLSVCFPFSMSPGPGSPGCCSLHPSHDQAVFPPPHLRMPWWGGIWGAGCASPHGAARLRRACGEQAGAWSAGRWCRRNEEGAEGNPEGREEKIQPSQQGRKMEKLHSGLEERRKKRFLDQGD